MMSDFKSTHKNGQKFMESRNFSVFRAELS